MLKSRHSVVLANADYGFKCKLQKALSALLVDENMKKNVLSLKFARFIKQKTEAIRSETETAKPPETLKTQTHLLNC